MAKRKICLRKFIIIIEKRVSNGEISKTKGLKILTGKFASIKRRKKKATEEERQLLIAKRKLKRRKK